MISLYPSEHEEQKMLMAWSKVMESRLPKLRLLHSTPNGGDRHPATAVKLKAEGVKAGVPDLCLPVAMKDYHGLFIEMKKKRGGRLSPEQKQWRDDLEAEGYQVVVCHGFDEARDAILNYLASPDRKEGGRP